MSYQSTLKALKNKYPSTYNNVLLCLFKKYYPAITSSIMDQLKIDSSSLEECPVIYNDLGIPDGFNVDNPIEISPMFLQRYVDSLIMKYNMIDDRYKKRKHLHTVLKPMLIKGASPDFTDEDIEDKPVDPEEFYNRNKDYINDLLVKIYDNSSELETLKLSNEEMQLVNFIDMYYFGLSNAFYFSDLLKNIYNELLRIIKEKNTFIEECYYIFKNILYSKIKNKEYPSNKIDNIERDYKILPTNLNQSYKRKNNMKKIRLKEYFPINNIHELQDFINNSTIQNKVFYARSLPQDFLDYVKHTLNVKLFDSRVIEVIYNEQLYDIPDENERINTEPKKNILIVGKVLSNKENLEGRKVFLFLRWGNITRYGISNDTPQEIKDMIETIHLSEIEGELISKIDSITRYNNEDKSIRGLRKSYNTESYKRKNNIQLKNYLQTKINISPKEAELIESVFKDYAKKKKQSRMEEVSFDDIKKGVSSGIRKVKSMFGKDKKDSNEQDVHYKKLRTNLFNSILQNQKILSELKEVGTFFNIFKDEHYSVTNRNELDTLFRYNLNVPKNIIKYAIDYGDNYPKSLSNSDNKYIFIDYVILSIGYATGNPNFEKKLYQYILNYYHVSKNIDVKEIESILFTNIYQNVFKENLYRNVEREVKEQIENIKKYADSVDKYETRSDTPTEKSLKYQSDKGNNITGLFPSTLLKLYLHFYPNSNKFEFKDIFQYTMQGRWDKFISEKKKSKGNTINLKNYLHKKLTISEKEATLIESAVRQYVQNSKRKK